MLDPIKTPILFIYGLPEKLGKADFCSLVAFARFCFHRSALNWAPDFFRRFGAGAESISQCLLSGISKRGYTG